MESKEEGLPREVVEALQSGESQLRHNWMYSFMMYSEHYIALVGYCKQCDQVVSANVPKPSYNNDGTGWMTELSRANIPKWGCIPVE